MFPRVAQYGAVSEFVSPHEYKEAQNKFKENLKIESYYQPNERRVPVSLKEIKDFNGKCFLLETEEIATLDQQFQGNLKFESFKKSF